MRHVQLLFHYYYYSANADVCLCADCGGVLTTDAKCISVLSIVIIPAICARRGYKCVWYMCVCENVNIAAGTTFPHRVSSAIATWLSLPLLPRGPAMTRCEPALIRTGATKWMQTEISTTMRDHFNIQWTYQTTTSVQQDEFISLWYMDYLFKWKRFSLGISRADTRISRLQILW